MIYRKTFVFLMFVCTLGKCCRKYFTLCVWSNVKQNNTKPTPKTTGNGNHDCQPNLQPTANSTSHNNPPPTTTHRRPQILKQTTTTNPQIHPSTKSNHNPQNKKQINKIHLPYLVDVQAPPRPYATATTVTHYDHHEHQIPRTQKKKKNPKHTNKQTAG
jgi:hypothetical protein